MKKIIYMFLTVVMTMSIFACAKGLETDDLNQTGLFDQNGNLIRNTLIYTNTVKFKGNIPIWATNSRVVYSIEAVGESDGTTYTVKYKTNYITAYLPDSPTDYYKISVPWAASGSDYHIVSYKDTNKLKELWLAQVFRKGAVDGRAFAIRNRDNDRGYWYETRKKNFQDQHPSYTGRYDYYYFDNNGDIIYKGGDKISTNKEILIKRFVGATIVDYRKVLQRTEESLINEADKITNTGLWTVGAIYKMAIDVNQAREQFGGGDAIDGAYDFIAARKKIWFKYNLSEEDKTTFIRQFYSTDFIEILVLNPFGNEGNKDCLGLDSYYAYYGDYRQGEGAMPVQGFTADNMPWMTDENLYLAKRPEWIVPLLSHTTTYTDWSRDWNFLAMPGHKY